MRPSLLCFVVAGLALAASAAAVTDPSILAETSTAVASAASTLESVSVLSLKPF
jgi:hypothetical protein